MSASPVVEISSLVKRYGRTTAVNGLSIAIDAGTITTVLGRNGAGKTTTLECCEGFRTPDSGTVRVLGLDPVRDGAALRPRIGVMLQEGAGLYPGARAVELIAHLARLHAHPLDVSALVERLGLDDAGRTPVRRLSGGQRQRVALAAALVGRPELVFLDEPTAGVDPQMRRSVWDLLNELRADGVSVVLTTHLMDEAERLSDHVVIIDDGRLIAAGTPQELTKDRDTAVRFAGPPRLDLTGLRAALPADATVEEAASGRYVITAAVDASLLATITSWCASNDVMPEGLQVARRSLEDVYIELTGRNPASS